MHRALAFRRALGRSITNHTHPQTIHYSDRDELRIEGLSEGRVATTSSNDEYDHAQLEHSQQRDDAELKGESVQAEGIATRGPEVGAWVVNVIDVLTSCSRRTCR